MNAPLPPLDPRRHAVFLDFDGTLVPFAQEPDAVRVSSTLVRRLEALQRLADGALAIVSGRRIADLDRFLAPLRFVAAGVHGLERRPVPGAPVVALAGPQTLAEVRAALGLALAALPRLTLEDKGTALVLHWRTAPDLADAARAAMARATEGRADLLVMEGEAIVEVHPAGMDKGRAVEDLMGSPPFAGRTVVYAGDDTTDEFALSVARRMGGLSIKIGPKPSAAEYRLADVAALHRWLGVGMDEGEGVR